MNAVEKLELEPDVLRRRCDPGLFEFESTADIDPLDEVIGQKRAVQALTFGLNMDSSGYNIFVTGREGSGKTTIVNDLVTRHAAGLATPSDWCLVNNFQDEYRPRAVALPPGKAVFFSRQVQRLIAVLRRKLTEVFEQESFEQERNAIKQRYERDEQDLLEEIEKAAAERKLALSKGADGYRVVALKDGQPMSREDYEALDQKARKAIDRDIRKLVGMLEETTRRVHKLRQALQGEIDRLMEQVALGVVRERIQVLKEDYAAWEGVREYLDALQADIVENVDRFLPSAREGSEDTLARFVQDDPADFFKRYRVNVLVDRRGSKGAPVVFEPNPTYPNVFGWIEKRSQMGTVTTDFTRVQSGSLLQANGGFLIMEIESVLMNAGVWEALKRALQNKKLYIEDPGSMGPYFAASLRPQPIPLDVKVILIGDYETFFLLQNHDRRFNKIFKVRADFDYEVERDRDTVALYARFIARVCRENGLLHFTPRGVAAVVEFGEKFIASQKKLSLRFGPIVGIIKEADYWARRLDAGLVSEQHVVKAFEEHRFRHNLHEEKIQEAYADRTLILDLDGAVVGQVNGLSVHQLGDIAFGRPSRITAETFMGREGVINIEREAGLSGRTHDKGVLILSGYLGRTFAQKHPLCLSVSITFEQNYGGIDGDSASSTELYAILSSLAGVPIFQGIAVTGSVDQKGRIQAIGGVNQKIEGFFDVCRNRGLTGKQGVIIPRSNVQNLMLKRQIVEAVAQGKFHIWAVEKVEEGIEILTGVPAGRPDHKGNWPPDTLYGKVQARLKGYLVQALKLHRIIEGLGL